MKRIIAGFAIVAFVVAFAGAVATPDEHGVNDSVAALTRRGGLRSVDHQHQARPTSFLDPFPVLAALATIALAGIASRRGSVALIGPHRRRIGDVGDDWRALLIGAPPQSA